MSVGWCFNGNINIRANNNDNNYNGLKNVINHGKRVAKAIDLRITVRRHAVEEHESHEDTRTELDFLLLGITSHNKIARR